MPDAFVDIIYDHFLANDPYEFEEGALAIFRPADIHTTGSLRKMAARKIPVDSFFICVPRTGFITTVQPKASTAVSRDSAGGQNILNDPEPVFEAFITHYEALKMAYDFFFPHVKTFAYHELIYLRGS